MIYLVKSKGYDGIYVGNLSSSLVDIFEEKKVEKKMPYSKPSWFKGTEDEYKDAKSKNDFSFGYVYEFDKLLLSESQFYKLFKHCEVIDMLEQDLIYHDVKIDLDVLTEKITNKVIKNSQHLFNQKLEVHQPNMPLFQYNEYIVESDCCTEILQDEYISKGWRVVCVCPQPDQRRPDYILGRYNNETNI